MTTADRLAEMICAINPRNLSDDILRHAETCIIDCLGAVAGGRHAASAPAVAHVATSLLAGNTASIWFRGEASSPTGAAWANAMAGTAADLDDGNRVAIGHPGVAVISSVLAAAEGMEYSGRDVLAAIVAGYEAGIRVSSARNMAVHRSTASGRWAGIGAAAALAHLRGYDVPTVRDAMLIAEQHAPGVLSADLHGFGGSHTKEGIAWSVVSAIFAADLAKAGFVPYRRTFDIAELYEPEIVLANPDGSPAILNTFFKPYGICRWIHCAIDAFYSVLDETNLDADAIQAVRVSTFRRSIDLANETAPTSFEAAQFSVPFALAVLALRGRPGLLPLDVSAMADPQVTDFAQRIALEFDPECEAEFPAKTMARVEVEAAGQTYQKFVEYPLGDPKNPMSAEQIENKFRTLAGKSMSSETATAIIAAVRTLSIGDMAPLYALLSTKQY